MKCGGTRKVVQPVVCRFWFELFIYQLICSGGSCSAGGKCSGSTLGRMICGLSAEAVVLDGGKAAACTGCGSVEQEASSPAAGPASQPSRESLGIPAQQGIARHPRPAGNRSASQPSRESLSGPAQQGIAQHRAAQQSNGHPNLMVLPSKALPANPSRAATQGHLYSEKARFDQSRYENPEAADSPFGKAFAEGGDTAPGWRH
jgi:hypothetical protein